MRTSAAVDRVVAILEFLAERPTESFSISELSRRLDISKATCHALVGSLIAARWAMRNPADMLVRVGPALIAAGARTAGRPRQLVDLARPDMDLLAQKWRAQGGASLAVGAEIIILETYNSGGTSRTRMYVGQRTPLRPPNGFVYLAWGKDTLVGREEFDTDEYREKMAVIRQRGFSVTLEMNLTPDVEKVLREVNSAAPEVEIDSVLASLLQSLRLVDYSALHIDDAKEYNVANVSVPALDDDGEVVIVVTLSAFSQPLTGADIVAVANDLRTLALSLTGVEVGAAPVK